jgi:hypothetical protein
MIMKTCFSEWIESLTCEAISYSKVTMADKRFRYFGDSVKLSLT